MSDDEIFLIHFKKCFLSLSFNTTDQPVCEELIIDKNFLCRANLLVEGSRDALDPKLRR